jgi:hypothetical protein
VAGRRAGALNTKRQDFDVVKDEVAPITMGYDEMVSGDGSKP